MREDEVEKRAAEIRASKAKAEQRAEEFDRRIKSVRDKVVERFLVVLRGRTDHPVTIQNRDDGECPTAVIFIIFYRNGQALNLEVGRFEVDVMNASDEDDHFVYNFIPSAAAYRISYPEIDELEEIRFAQQGEAISQAVVVTFELLANLVAEGGEPGTQHSVNAKVIDLQIEQRRAAQVAREERARDTRNGCFAALGIFFGILFLISALGRLSGHN